MSGPNAVQAEEADRLTDELEKLVGGGMKIVEAADNLGISASRAYNLRTRTKAKTAPKKAATVSHQKIPLPSVPVGELLEIKGTPEAIARFVRGLYQ
jgi:transposase